MRDAVSFNPHWIGKVHTRDIRLINGDIHRDVPDVEILRLSSRRHPDIVRECDIQDYGRHHLQRTKAK